MNIIEKSNLKVDAWFYGLVALVLLVIECISLYSIPTTKYLEEQGTMLLLPVEAVRKSTTSRRYHISSKYYVKYGAENYFTYEKAEDSIAAKSAVSMQIEKPYILYTSTKDPEIYRLVKSGSTLEKTLSEERNPHLSAGVIWLIVTIMAVRRIIIYRN
ncbi:MAG: hypothetical protein R3Y07_08735 [Eubacteriales bacterium]